jgi:hypothetical protein
VPKITRSALLNALRGGAMTAPQNNVITGGNVSIYEPRTMMAPFSKRMPVTTWLRETFFPGFTPFDTKHVDMDFFKNRQRVAPYVAEGSGAINIKRDGFQTKTYTAPFINIARPYDVELGSNRSLGEPVYGGMTPDERILMLMQSDYNELDDMITRREEVSCAELLQSGVVTITGYIDDKATVVRTDTISYGFDNTIDLTGADQWDQATFKGKYGDLVDAVNLVRKAGYNPEIVLLGSSAARALLDDDNFVAHYLDRRYAMFGEINPQLNIQNGNGYAYLGRLTELGIDLFTYLAWYYDDTTQTLKPYIGDNKVIVAPRDLGQFLYGAITQIPHDSDNFQTIAGPRVTKLFIDRKADAKELQLKSRPVVKPDDVASWVVINTMV